MINYKRVISEGSAEARSFIRKPAAVFFTFVFPLILIAIFVVLIEAQGEGGLLAESQAFYLPGYLGFVVLLTPLSRLSSTVARSRDKRRFEKLATTPLNKWEWMLAHALVNAVMILIASLLIVLIFFFIPWVEISLSLWIIPFIAIASMGFCGLGAIIGELVNSEDGAIAASNAVGFPVLFLSETFVPSDILPSYIAYLIEILPLTYFTRGMRKATAVETGSISIDIFILTAMSVLLILVASYLLPWRTD